MGKKFEVELFASRYPLKYRLLMYEIARLFVDENLSYGKIPQKLYEWAIENAGEFYHADGTDNITRAWIKQQMSVIKRDYKFIKKGEFGENELGSNIKQRVDVGAISLEIAPDVELLLRQVCMKFDEILAKRLRSSSEDEEVVIGVSGGKTMLALAQTLHDIKTQMTWYKMASKKDKERVVVCSLTSGGTRDNIKALSDTVAANIAEALGVKAKGLLGPPSFKDEAVHDAFVKEPEVENHKQLVQKAGVILTSVGNVNDDSSLTSQIFNVVDKEYLPLIRKEHKHLGDILYQCYDGYYGNIIGHSGKISKQIFVVIELKDIQQKVKDKQLSCILVATGKDKGKHALRGAILSRLASDIYMDISCAQGLNDICEQGHP